MSEKNNNVENEKMTEAFTKYKEVFLKDYVMTPSVTDVADLTVYDCGKEQCISEKHVDRSTKPYYLFHYIEQGNGIFIQNGIKYDVKAGEAFVIFPWQEIEYYTTQNHPWLYKWFSVGGRLADSFVEKAGISIANPVIRADKYLGFREAVNDLVNSFLEEGNINLGCVSHLYMIFHRLLEQSERAKKSKYDNHYVNEAIMFINYNLNLPIEVSDIAKSINLNQRYFINLFFKHVGLTPKQYIVKVKMDAAASMLKNKKVSVSDVAGGVGYSDPFHFSREFKKHFGISPKKFQITRV